MAYSKAGMASCSCSDTKPSTTMTASAIIIIFAAIAALQAVLAVEPNQVEARGRLDVVRLRVSQRELGLAERARADGRPTEAEAHLLRALEATPENGPVLRALSAIAVSGSRCWSASKRSNTA